MVREQAAIMMRNGITAGQASIVLREQHGSLIQPKDIHRIAQTNRENTRSLSDGGLSMSDMQAIVYEIKKKNDQYRIKYKGETQVMDCLVYWNPSDIQLARRFCQVVSDALSLYLIV